jgi:hypothetical protein
VSGLGVTDRHHCGRFVRRFPGPERDERAHDRDRGSERPQQPPATGVRAGTRRQEAIQSLTSTLSSRRGPVLPRHSTRRTVR